MGLSYRWRSCSDEMPPLQMIGTLPAKCLLTFDTSEIHLCTACMYMYIECVCICMYTYVFIYLPF